MKVIKSKGKSMKPFFLKDKLLVVKKLNSKNPNLKVGDLVWISNPQKSFVHRAIALKNNTVLTKGDNEDKADAWLEIKKVKGKVVGFYSDKKYYSLETYRSEIGNFIIAQISKYLANKNLIKKVFRIFLSHPKVRTMIKKLA